MLHSRLLQYIDQVARYRSIRKAAEKLNVSSSSVNRQIIAYEELLGHQIFERLPRGVRLTAAGELLITHIRSTLKDHERFLGRIDEMKSMRRTTVSIATLEALQSDVIAEVIGRFIPRYPYTRFAVESVPADRIVATVVEGGAAIGLGFDIDLVPQVNLICAASFNLGVVVAPDHPLAKKASVRLSDCVGHAFALPATHLVMRGIIDRMLASSNAYVHPVAETNSIDLLKSLVATAGLASFLTSADVDAEHGRGSLVHVPLVGIPNEAQTLRLIQRKGVPLAPAATIFAEELAGFIQKMSSS
ncbi:LysR family transcriptional regulator [Paracoccus sp. MBLB3053]|uniref:LysR family transcriptional regulator n=1 Tax=Paracoccus aurantius TaxID=3073814 RepID=A0ABU2HVV4_9RHOB|nr:LysR family transcriptional regulator [Paracoccus sp. MBLB3053]MDS9469181.1 LysR family transcriptional regulator [Paracoccus sp. MBLB3053]